MKGRTTCPRCKHEFVLDAPSESKICEVVCPSCKNKFAIKPASSESKSGDDCSWEEHGEPRKTILSSIKPKTNRPAIAAVLLIVVFILGITSAAFPNSFIETPLEGLSNIGITGKMELTVIDQLNNSIENVLIKIDGKTYTTNENGILGTENISLGIKEIEIYLEGYKTQKHEILIIPFFTSSHEIKISQGDENDEEYTPFDTISCSIILAIFSVFAILAALMSFERQHLDVAVVGSILGIFSIGFFIIGSIISIIALIIIIISRDEFENGKKGKVF